MNIPGLFSTQTTGRSLRYNIFSVVHAIVPKNFVISNGSPGRLVKFLLKENIFILQNRRNLMARGLHGFNGFPQIFNIIYFMEIHVPKASLWDNSWIHFFLNFVDFV